jgi:hypothetical protein
VVRERKGSSSQAHTEAASTGSTAAYFGISGEPIELPRVAPARQHRALPDERWESLVVAAR